MLCKNCDLRINKCFCHFDVLHKSQEHPEGGIEESRNASDSYIKSDQLAKKCAVTLGK